MKLVIQIPCLNEAETLPATIAALPRAVPGFDEVELLVIDDGSTDGTAAVALHCGVDHVLRMNGNRGLARAFVAGLMAATDRGADLVVNTDADNQYCGECVFDLVRPILEGKADMVIGARPIAAIRHFSPLKKWLQGTGSRVVRAVCGADIRDAPSGFRAVSRNAALRLNVFGDFTYTIETVIQAALCNLRVMSVPVRTNPPDPAEPAVQKQPELYRQVLCDDRERVHSLSPGSVLRRCRRGLHGTRVGPRAAVPVHVLRGRGKWTPSVSDCMRYFDTDRSVYDPGWGCRVLTND